MSPFGRRAVAFVASIAFGAAIGSTRAAVLNTQAVVSASVQELIDGRPGSVNSDRKQLGVDAAEPPIEVGVDLVSTDLNGILVSLGQSFSRFTDPILTAQQNPREFAIEVGCYSNAASVAYSVQSLAEETRELLFVSRTTGGIRPEIQFRSDGTREIESRLFVTGAVVMWATRPDAVPGDLNAELVFRVARSGQEAPLFEGRVNMVPIDGTNVELTATGGLTASVVSLAELAELGVDAESLEVLQAVADSGALQVVVLHPQEIAYTYVVRADEAFDLKASLEAKLANAPNGTGVAAVLGRPFENLAEFIALGLPGVDGEAIEEAINRAVAEGDVGNNTGQPDTSPRPAVCGVLGMEALGLAGLFMSLVGRGRRTRTR